MIDGYLIQMISAGEKDKCTQEDRLSKTHFGAGKAHMHTSETHMETSKEKEVSTNCALARL